MEILVTGGAGYIGSSVASALMDAGHTPIILDSLITGRREFCEGRETYFGDVADGVLVDRILRDHPAIRYVVHCAGLIVVADSVARPIEYYTANVVKTLDLVRSLLRGGVHRILFSSSASIYSAAADFSVDEDSPIAPTSPYARTKAIVERMLTDISSGTRLRSVSLRYFNPIGADPKLRTGLQLSYPSHALGQLILADQRGRPFPVTGTGWATRDGTGIRDYVSVWDLALAHVAAIERFDDLVATSPSIAINIGTGNGSTVRELVRAYERAVGHSVATADAPQRPGDVPGAFTRSNRAKTLLGWRAHVPLDAAIRSALNWAQVKPHRLRS